MKINRSLAFVALASLCSVAIADPVYSGGSSTPLALCPTCVVGVHLPQAPNGSVPGLGGSGINVPAGSALDGQRTYIYDLGYPGYAAGAPVARGAADFAMLVWDMGVAMNTMRLYTHQDHYGGGPVTTDFVAQDLMEYSVWGSNDNVTFFLLSDVIGFNINGGGAGLPTYTFLGTEPSIIYRGGSPEFGIINAYTRDYTFAASYRYYGIRSSLISRQLNDADPELDAIIGNPRPIVGKLPEPGSLALLSLGLAMLAMLRRRAS